jgi:hypothetical protein
MHYSTKLFWFAGVTAACSSVAVDCLVRLWMRRNAKTFEEWEKHNDRFKEHFSSFCFGAGLILLLTAASWLDKHGHTLLEWFVGEFGLPKVQYLVGALVLMTGIGAYQYKKKLQKFYGLTEVVFGVFAAIIATKHVDLDRFFPTLATLGGCVYIVARGSINFVEGPKLMPRNPYLDRVQNQLRWEENQKERRLQNLNAG